MVVANRKKHQQQQYARELEEDLLRSKEQGRTDDSTQRYSQPRRVPEQENTSYAIGGSRRDTSQGNGRVSNLVFKNEMSPGGITYYDAALDHHQMREALPLSDRENGDSYSREISSGRQGSSAPYATIPQSFPDEDEYNRNRGSLRRVQDFKSRKEAWDRLQAEPSPSQQGGPRSPYKYMDVPDDNQVSDTERAIAHEKAVRRRQQEQYAREILEASNQRPVGMLSSPTISSRSFVIIYCQILLLFTEIPRESTLRQTYVGTGIPGDSRSVKYANMHGDMRIGGPQLRR